MAWESTKVATKAEIEAIQEKIAKERKGKNKEIKRTPGQTKNIMDATKEELDEILAELPPGFVVQASKRKTDYNSVKNQEIKRKFVDREVLYCVSSLIYELSKKDEYFEELMPILQQPDYDAAISEIIETEPEDDVLGYLGIAHPDNLQETIDNMYNSDKADMCNHFYAELENIEALEHWIVSDWLARKLEAQDEMIDRDFLGLTIWGRATSGQAILLDSVISRICENLEILEGQKNEWKV